MSSSLPDSTDWLPTPLSALGPLESSLRCQVCKDFFTTPMLTSCSHTFCSLCIRRYLSQEGRCPACREQDQELKLRRNWAVEEAVGGFVAAREGVLAFARGAVMHADGERTTGERYTGEKGEGRAAKRRKLVKDGEVADDAGARRSTRSQSKRAAATASQEVVSTQEEIRDSDDEGSVYHDDGDAVMQQVPSRQRQQQGSREPNDGLVACPNCARRMKEAQINTHLDRCLQGLPTSPSPPPATVAVNNAAQSLAFAPRTKSPIVTASKDRLPSINYALYTETSLRKKLKELGISNHGTKELMRKRHIEWVNLWNANCDSNRPRTKRELLKDLDTWERTLGRQIDGAKGGASGVMVKDFDRDGWAKSQKGEFDDLIAKARAQRQAKAAAAEVEVDLNEKRSMATGSEEGPTVNGTGTETLQSNTESANGLQGKKADGPEPQVGNADSAARVDAMVSEHIPDTPHKESNVTHIDLISSPAGLISVATEDQQIETPGKRSKFFE